MTCYRNCLVRILSFAFAMMLLLSGCSSLRENDEEMVITNKNQEENVGKLHYYPLLYTSDRLSSQINSYTELVELDDWSSSARTILYRCFEDASIRVFGIFADFIDLEDMIFTGDILNIYMSSDIYINDNQRFDLATLMTDTMVRNFSVNYVNIVIGGTGPSINGYPLGLMEYQEGSLLELYEQQENIIAENSESYMKNFGLYFVDEENGFVIPEVRSITINGGVSNSTVLNILEEMSMGPNIYPEYMTPLSNTFIRRSLKRLSDEKLSEYFTYENGVFSLFNANQFFTIGENNPNINLYLSSMYCTLKGLMPDMERLVCHWSNKVTIMEDSKANEYLGDIVSIYLPKDDMISIEKIDRVISSDDVMDESVMLELLARGKIKGDPNDVISVFPGGLTKDDLIGMRYNGDCLILDFNDDFIVSLSRLTDQGIDLMIYSIVDTFCEIPPVKRVQILVNGKTVEELEYGNISIKSPLFFNPGIIRK